MMTTAPLSDWLNDRVVPPSLVVFDLDFTLWYPEMYEMEGAPFTKCVKTGRVTDRVGEEVQLFPGAVQALRDLQSHAFFRDTRVAVASRTTYPEWASRCLELIHVHDNEDLRMRHVIHHEAIYPGNKQAHFAQIHEESGIPYEEMLFYDNAFYNIVDVRELGVTCIHCPDGLTPDVWYQGLLKYSEQRSYRSS